MPTVPTSFVPQADISSQAGVAPFEATPGQPAQNLAAGQAVELGNALVQAGNVEYRIGAIMQDNLNDGNAKQAETQWLTQAQDMLRGQNGYFNAYGKDADTKYQATQDALSASANTVMDGLGNDTQKAMFMQTTSRNMAQFRGQMLDHKSKEAFRFATNESQARAVNYISNAVNEYQSRGQIDQDGQPTGAFNASAMTAINETREYAKSVGIPLNSFQMLEMERGVTTAITGGVVNRLMLNDEYKSALDYVVSQKENGLIDEKAAQSLLTSVSANRDRQMTSELAESISLYGTLDTPAGTSNFTNPVKGGAITLVTRPGQDGESLPVGVSITAEAGTPVVSPSDGIVISKIGEEAVIRMDDGSEVTFVGVGKVNNEDQLFEGKRLKRDDLIGAFAENQPISYRIVRNGEPIDIRNDNSLDPMMNRDAARRPQTEQEALAIAGSIDRREIRDGVKQRISQRYAQDRAMATQENQRVVEAVTRSQVADPNAAIPPAMFAALTPDQQSDVIRYTRKANDMDIMLQIAENPSILTRQFVFDNKSKLTNETFIKLLDQVGSGKLIEATVDADMVNATLAVGNIELTKEQSLQMRVNIEKKIYEMQSDTGKKLDRDQKQMIIDRTIADTVYKPGWIWDSKPMPAAIYTPSELQGMMRTLTPANRAAVIERLQLVKGIRNPTESQIETEWETMGKAGTK
jgi:murein DD-endopeptidase MepM/ murein hydrolase activator NlpD